MKKWKTFPNLFTTRLELRQLQSKDAAAIFVYRSDEEQEQYIDRPVVKSVKEVELIITNLNEGIAEKKWLFWGLFWKETNDLIGTICLWNFDKYAQKVELGYELHPSFQGKGYMNEAIASVIEFAFNTLKVRRIAAFTHHQNLASQRVLERHQFIQKASMKELSQKAGKPVEMIFFEREI